MFTVLSPSRSLLGALVFVVMLAGCTGADSSANPPPEPTATAVPLVFDGFFAPGTPPVTEPVWYESEPPDHWPALIPLPRSLDMGESSFVDFLRESGDREITGRLYYNSGESYPATVRQRLLDLGFRSVKYTENRAGSVAVMEHGGSTAEVLASAFGYTMLIISE